MYVWNISFLVFFSTQVMYYRASQAALMVITWLLMQEMKETQAWFLGWGRFLGGGLGKLLQYSCLENPLGRRARQATVHRVTQSRTQLKRWLCMHAHNVLYRKWMHASNNVHWLTTRQNINGLWVYEGTPLLPAACLLLIKLLIQLEN